MPVGIELRELYFWLLYWMSQCQIFFLVCEMFQDEKKK